MEWWVVRKPFPSLKRTPTIEEPRAELPRVEKWIGFNTRSRSLVRGAYGHALDVLGLDCLCEFQIIHNVLEMESEYFSMNAVIDD